MDRTEFFRKKQGVSIYKVAGMTGNFYKTMRENEVTLTEARMIVQKLNRLLDRAERRSGYTRLSEIPKTEVFSGDQEDEERFRELMEEYMKSKRTVVF